MNRFPYHQWPDEAVDLVETSIRAHGGWDAWKGLEVIRLEPAFLRGLLPAVKGYGRTFGLPRSFEARPHRGVVMLEGFPDPETTGVYEAGVVSLVDAKTTETLIGSIGHRKTLAGSARRRRWTPLDALYFLGYAMLHDHSVPFTLGEAAFVSMRTVTSRGETLAAIELDFPPARETHCVTQTVYFGPEGLVRRNDFVVEIVSPLAKVCQLWEDYEPASGFRLPMRRRVTARLSGRPLPFTVLDTKFSRIEVE